MNATSAVFVGHEVGQRINLLAGLWAVIAPWALGFSAVTAAMWAHVIAGAVVAIVANGSIWLVRNRPFSTA